MIGYIVNKPENTVFFFMEKCELYYKEMLIGEKNVHLYRFFKNLQ